MTFRPFAALCALALLAPLAHAQDFAGRFTIAGKDSLNRDVSATVKITSSPAALSVDRDGRVQTSAGAVTARWRSSSARLASPRVLRVTYRVAVPGTGGNLVASLNPETATTSAALAALERENVLEAVYFLSADGGTLREVVLNSTRFAPERWRSLEAKGQRVTTTTTTITETELKARVDRAVRAWYASYTNATYVRLLADATTAAERARLTAAKARDADFAATCELTEGDDTWEGLVDDHYTAGGYRDANGAVVPRASVRIFSLGFMPEHAGIGLSKAFVFDGRTGAVLEEGDVQD